MKTKDMIKKINNRYGSSVLTAGKQMIEILNMKRRIWLLSHSLDDAYKMLALTEKTENNKE